MTIVTSPFSKSSVFIIFFRLPLKLKVSVSKFLQFEKAFSKISGRCHDSLVWTEGLALPEKQGSVFSILASTVPLLLPCMSGYCYFS